VFVQFLVSLFKNAKTPRLKKIVCEQIAIISLNPELKELLIKFYGTVQVITNALEIDGDEELFIIYTRALINLSSSNIECKSVIVESKAMPVLITQLKINKNTEVIQDIINLIKNISNSPENRRKIADCGAIPIMVKLIRLSEIPGVRKASETQLIPVIVALWSLAADSDIRNLIINEDIIPLLIGLLQNTKSNIMVTKISGLLMALACENDAAKKVIGKLGAMPLLVTTLFKTSNKSVMKSVMGVLAILSSDTDNLMIMKHLYVERVVDRCIKTKDEETYNFARHIKYYMTNTRA